MGNKKLWGDHIQRVPESLAATIESLSMPVLSLRSAMTLGWRTQEGTVCKMQTSSVWQYVSFRGLT
eukprot:m.189878 g.189878  ORF g.189878 m.189878 type:complete len:66 (+) comp18535_c0_seq4:1462-1659(+)